jgi:HTH-type transcriptional regulator, transcriptional repressor of NAD biosynthesis genes
MNAALNARRRFTLGLVVGKFSPLHRGHEWLIERAAAQCDRLLILSYANPEFARCAAPQRQRWLNVRFPQHETISIDDAWLRRECSTRDMHPRPIPDNHSSDETQQQFLGWLLKSVLQRAPDALFCSEAYGISCASVLTTTLGSEVTAVVEDLDRRHVPISATQIRSNPGNTRQWLNPDVASAFVSRIVLLGGESSGKTTLAAALAHHFGTTWVAEYGRELWEAKNGALDESDLIDIVREQVRREVDGLRAANHYLFCDTSPLTTAGYSEWMFGRVDPRLSALATRPYDAVILCQPDFPFVQDGTRREGTFRLQQHAWYVERVTALTCPFLEAAGPVPQRVAQVAQWLSRPALQQSLLAGQRCE